MAKTGSIDIQMKELLDEVSQEVRDAGANSIKKISKESVSKLRNACPKKTGDYAAGWTAKKISDMEIVVHNKTDYQLTHLLENGHIIKNKKGTYGRTRPIKHIAPVEEWAESALPDEIMRELQ